MKALVYEKAHSIEDFAMQLVKVAEPGLRDTDVLVEVRAIGVNPGETFFPEGSAGSSPALSSKPGLRPRVSGPATAFSAPEICRETARGPNAWPSTTVFSFASRVIAEPVASSGRDPSFRGPHPKGRNRLVRELP